MLCPEMSIFCEGPVSITGSPPSSVTVVVMMGNGLTSGSFPSLTTSVGSLLSSGMKSSSIKSCKFLSSRGGWRRGGGAGRFNPFKIVSDKARISTSIVLGGAVGGIGVG